MNERCKVICMILMYNLLSIWVLTEFGICATSGHTDKTCRKQRGVREFDHKRRAKSFGRHISLCRHSYKGCYISIPEMPTAGFEDRLRSLVGLSTEGTGMSVRMDLRDKNNVNKKPGYILSDLPSFHRLPSCLNVNAFF